MVAEEDDDFNQDWKNENQMSLEDWDNEYSHNEKLRREQNDDEQYDVGETSSNVEYEEKQEELETFSPIKISEEDRNRSRPNWENKPGETVSLGIGFGQNLKKMARESWGSERPLPRPNLNNPVTKVRFTYTSTPTCSTMEECMKSCKDIQKYYMDLGFADIPYNFLIGGDGVVYHGRGWLKQAERPFKYKNLKKTCIDVAYIGNFDNYEVPFSMLAVGADFLKYSLKVGKLTPLYQSFTFAGEKHV